MRDASSIDSGELRREFPTLRLLVLHGSRARGDAHARSDWDFAYRADGALDELGLRAMLSRILGTDAVDVADVDRAGGLLRYRAARDGKVLLERERGEFARFSEEALRFWLDAAPVVRAGYADVLGKLDR